MNLKINNINIYRDGGTISIQTNQGTYCIDGRLLSNNERNKTKGMLFLGYPSHSDPLSEQETKKLKREFKIALKEFGMQSLKYQECLPLIESIKTTGRKKY